MCRKEYRRSFYNWPFAFIFTAPFLFTVNLLVNNNNAAFRFRDKPSILKNHARIFVQMCSKYVQVNWQTRNGKKYLKLLFFMTFLMYIINFDFSLIF